MTPRSKTNKAAPQTRGKVEKTDAFNGFNQQSSLDAIRAESDRIRTERMNLSISKAKNEAEIAKLKASHEAYWTKLEQNRVIRLGIPLKNNIKHGLNMIKNNQKLLNKGVGIK